MRGVGVVLMGAAYMAGLGLHMDLLVFGACIGGALVLAL